MQPSPRACLPAGPPGAGWAGLHVRGGRFSDLQEHLRKGGSCECPQTNRSPHTGVRCLRVAPGRLQRSPGARKSLAGATAHGIRVPDLPLSLGWGHLRETLRATRGSPQTFPQ